MKLFTLTATALLASVACSAAATEPWQQPERESAVMLYFSKSFGSVQPQDRSPLAFGFRLQQQGLWQDMGPVTLLDARYSLGGRKQLLVAGLSAFSTGASDESSAQSSTMSAEHKAWTAVGIAAAVLALWCAFECGSDGDGDNNSDYPGGS